MMKEDNFKNIMKASKLEASENFKDRVMHQIEMSEALRPKKQTSVSYTPQVNFGVFGVMYVILLLVAVFFYFDKGNNLLNSNQFYKIIIFISMVSSVFYLISVFDDALKMKKKN